MKVKILIALFVTVTAGLIAFSQINQPAFAPAEDFPREAILYVQIADLPAFIKLWNESTFKEKYTESDNFYSFKNNHLGRKLASRWQEFNDAAGFPIDLEVLSRFAGNQAAIALYDVGKLEFVFIAPISDEIFAATKFAQNRDKFTEETLADGTIVYRVNVEADRGRQKQELIFTQTKGRFILATSEILLAQTLNNIRGRRTKNRLIDEPSFKFLSEKIEPHTATVWLNQAALNDDYYFKRYWLMSDTKNLKNIRAGIFDFEMQTGKFIERRKFLLDKAVEIPLVKNSETTRILAFLPPDIPFYRLQSANGKTIDEAVGKTIFARRKIEEKKRRSDYSNYSSFNDYENYSGNDYEFLGGNFDETINEIDDNETVERDKTEIDFSKILQSANPQSLLTFTQPKQLPAPLFVEFQRAAVINLASPESFDRDNFEAAIARKISAQVMIAAPGVKLNWETITEENYSRRELKLPILGWNVSYTVRGNSLILANDVDFLRKIAAAPNQLKAEPQNSPFSTLTVINLDERKNAYDNVFAVLDQKKLADEFFTENIDSLLDSVSGVRKIEIKENYSRNIFDEEIIFNFN